MMGRWRRLMIAGAGVGAAGVAVLLAMSAVTVGHAVGQLPEPGCYNVSLDGGTLPSAPIDAGTEAGIRLYQVTVAGSAVIAPLTLQIYDGDLAHKISEQTIATAGAWTRSLSLELGWHKLIFRVLRGGRSWETVRWIGLATGAPTWSTPTWSTEPDGGARCWDAGCVPLGVVPRCGGPNTYRCGDGGCQDAINPGVGGPVGCVRGCGFLAPLPDAGCASGCPGLTDAGTAYRPSCCAVNVGSNGLRRTPPYSVSVAGLSSEIAEQVTAQSKVTVVSSSSADKNHDIFVFGVSGDGFPRYEVIRTNATAGTTPVSGTLKWITILGARDHTTPAGTITMTSTTGGQTILTLTSAARTKGLRYVGSSQGALIGQRPLRAHADDATTAPVGMFDGTSFDGCTLNGTASVDAQYRSAFATLEWLAVGALSDERTITIDADEGWCSGGIFNKGRDGEVLININFSGISEPGGGGCGAHHIMVLVGESKLPWPPPPLDAGYSLDAWRASVYPRWAYQCRPRLPGSTTPTVPWNHDAGVAGAPHCFGGWCCVLAKAYRVPDGGGL